MTNPEQKKEPPHGNETASSVSSITGRKYTTSEQKKISSLKKKLKRNAILPGHVFVGEWRQLIGPAYPLLGLLVCAGDWNKGRWMGQIWLLAEVIGKSERTITDWIRRLKKINGFEVRYYPYSISIHLPASLIPNNNIEAGREKFPDKGRKRNPDRQVPSSDRKNWRSELKTKPSKNGSTQPKYREGLQHFSDLI